CVRDVYGSGLDFW
nr:immunoglobulin heavy chain junction region [Macaca mulatta]MOX95895.1 immunoglobulin heavy chain junction region [Macaca mulatta]MOX96575.1 immunoglobulin heavy chain junction region [Macaca mulatta]